MQVPSNIDRVVANVGANIDKDAARLEEFRDDLEFFYFIELSFGMMPLDNVVRVLNEKGNILSGDGIPYNEAVEAIHALPPET